MNNKNKTYKFDLVAPYVELDKLNWVMFNDSKRMRQIRTP